MNENVKILREVAEQTECEFRSDYSGRRMFGRECVGIVCQNPLVICLLLGKAGFDVDLVVERDNMGRDTIVYFPELQDDSDEDEDPGVCQECGLDTCDGDCD